MDQEIEDIQEKLEVHDEILLAALQLFANNGYFNTSLIDIKDAAGINTIGIIHKQFKTKQAIAAQLYENIHNSLSHSIDEIKLKNENSSEQLRAIVDLFFKLTEDAPDVMRFLLISKVSEFIPEAQALCDSAAVKKIIRIIDEGISTGEIRSMSPELAYAHFFGIIENTLRLKLTGFLDKKAEFYQSQAWLAAWNTIVKK